uniref:Uncharacterized protein n=1 Tax=Nomascus leucogenys TaxID=61853 RepID=A0A2I3H0W7_NOMLE
MATERKTAELVVPLFVDQYFTCCYKADVKGRSCEDHCMPQHSNRICWKNKGIPCQISTNCSRFQNKVSGKFKRGAQFLTELAPLCRIYCSVGEEYTVSSCVRGCSMEPSILQEKSSTEESKNITEGLLTQKQYEEVIVKCINATTATS